MVVLWANNAPVRSARITLAVGACCRYFTPPFVLSMLHLKPPPARFAQLTAAAYVAVTILLLYVFAARPYTWGDGTIARFMW
jgi:alpha-1,2-glucosyltransferase